MIILVMFHTQVDECRSRVYRISVSTAGFNHKEDVSKDRTLNCMELMLPKSNGMQILSA